MYFLRVFLPAVLLWTCTFAEEAEIKERKPRGNRRFKNDESRVDYWGHDLPADCHVPKSSHIGNGFCGGGKFNRAECNWDGGDCCEDTCIDGEYKCGKWSEYKCKNPDVIGEATEGSGESSISGEGGSD